MSSTPFGHIERLSEYHCLAATPTSKSSGPIHSVVRLEMSFGHSFRGRPTACALTALINKMLPKVGDCASSENSALSSRCPSEQRLETPCDACYVC
eukprot:scaffold291765_cov35-Tisochrysis_lutea.AAC.2